MASSKDYLQFVLEQLSELQEITYRAMMGEFIIYYQLLPPITFLWRFRMEFHK